jgi:ABC-type maltose transport system permease subunit
VRGGVQLLDHPDALDRVSVGTGNAPQLTHVVMGATISVVPIVALFLLLPRYWRNDLPAGAVKV